MKTLGMQNVVAKLALLGTALAVALALVFGFASTAQADPVTVDKSRLAEAIQQSENSAAQTATSADGKDIDVDKFWTTAAVRAEFTNAIDAAKVVNNNASATQAQVDAAAKTLNDALTKYDQAKKAGTKPPVPKVFKRLGGETAYETMDLIVREGWNHSNCVVIAQFDGFWDALSASSLAGLHDAPILLTDTNELKPITAKLITDLQASEAHIVGGTAAISDKVEAAVKDCLIGAQNVVRHAGPDAQDTAIEIAKAKEAEKHSNTCIVATSGTFQDALAASPFAFDKLAPIYLTDAEGKLAQKTIDAIKEGNYDLAVVVGGPAAVKEETEVVLKSQAGVKEAIRRWGQNAYETSFQFARYALEQGMLANHMGVATVFDYQDALTGGALCGKNDGVLVLASNDAENGCQNTLLVKENKGGVATGFLFGGSVALNDNVLKAFDDAA